jgi:hypothetical protein
MNIVLWTFQALLAFVFGASAIMKGTWEPERLVRSGQTGVKGLSVPLIRFIALSELLGALGLVLPWALGIATWLTPLAALGLGIIMLLAAGVHLSLREPGNVLKTLAVLAACLGVAFGRGLRMSVL